MNFHSHLFADYFFSCGFLKAEKSIETDSNKPLTAIFDVSSLTKALITAPEVFSYYQVHNLDLKTPFGELGFLENFPKKIRDLNAYTCLRHETGLPAWRNFFTRSENLERSVSDVFQDIQLGEKKAVYSDLGYILMAQIKDFEFKINSFDPKVAVSTGYSAIRQKNLVGEVHDDNAFAIQRKHAFAGHAGLFLTGPDLVQKLKNLQDNTEYPGYFAANAALISSNLTNESLLGFRQGGDESARVFFSGKTMGHYGFTGCAFWIEPQTSAYVVLLTNRVASSFAIQNDWKKFRQDIFSYAYQKLKNNN